MIKAVIFDMDGLLIDSEPLWQSAERTAFQTVGIELTDKNLFEQIGTRIDEVVAHRYHQKPWQGPTQKDIEAMIVDKVIEDIKQKGQAKPGVKQALDLCRKQALPMAVASSSTTEVIDAVLDRLKIRKYFQHTYSAEYEKYGKPHPGIFITTASLLQTHFRDCLVFEDSPSGVLAAKAAKMKCIAIPDPANRDNKFIQTADLILNSLEEFDEKLLAKLAV